MPLSTNPTPDADLLCSFCSKPEPAVRSLVAGPGKIFICDECVDLSARIIADSGSEESERSRAAYLDPSVETVLTTVRELVEAGNRVETHLLDSVSRLRELGTDWDVIEAAAGIGAESLRARLERASASR